MSTYESGAPSAVLHELADFRHGDLTQSEWRLGQVTDNVTTTQQTIRRISRLLSSCSGGCSGMREESLLKAVASGLSLGSRFVITSNGALDHLVNVS